MVKLEIHAGRSYRICSQCVTVSANQTTEVLHLVLCKAIFSTTSEQLVTMVAMCTWYGIDDLQALQTKHAMHLQVPRCLLFEPSIPSYGQQASI